MKYFTYELIAAANDWVEQTRPELLRAGKRFNSAVEDYRRALESLKPRVSGAAWDFFRHGFGEQGLHDARLLSLKVGDGFLFASGASVVVQFQRLVFRRRRIKRQYEIGEMYR